jgi:hypothetical protein
MKTAALLLILASFSVIAWQIIYFARQRKECQKYPFFKLRDDIVWHLATTDHSHRPGLKASKNRDVELSPPDNFTDQFAQSARTAPPARL